MTIRIYNLQKETKKYTKYTTIHTTISKQKEPKEHHYTATLRCTSPHHFYHQGPIWEELCLYIPPVSASHDTGQPLQLHIGLLTPLVSPDFNSLLLSTHPLSIQSFLCHYLRFQFPFFPTFFLPDGIHSSICYMCPHLINFSVCLYIIQNRILYIHFDVCLSVHLCICIEKKNQLDATECFIALIIRSTCFGHFYAHRQELETICVITVYGVRCLGCWLLEVRCRASGYAFGMRDVARATSVIPNA
jgi:hypothetical protein